MPMDFNYTSKVKKYPHEAEVYHAFFSARRQRRSRRGTARFWNRQTAPSGNSVRSVPLI